MPLPFCGEPWFEGVVDNFGRSQTSNEVLPHLIEVIFTDFPGEPGKTMQVGFEIPKTDSASAY